MRVTTTGRLGEVNSSEQVGESAGTPSPAEVVSLPRLCSSGNSQPEGSAAPVAQVSRVVQRPWRGQACRTKTEGLELRMGTMPFLCSPPPPFFMLEPQLIPWLPIGACGSHESKGREFLFHLVELWRQGGAAETQLPEWAGRAGLEHPGGMGEGVGTPQSFL